MLWILLAISSHFCWAVENVASKYAVEKRIRNPYVFLIFFTILEIMILVLIPFVNFFVPSPKILLLLFLAGLAYFFGSFPYIKAMQIEEVTRINILWALIPVISLFLGFFIGDKLNLREMVSLIFLIIGSILASLHLGKKGSWNFSKAFWLMVLSCFSYSIYGVLMRYIERGTPYTVAYIWNLLFDVLAAFLVLFFLKKLRREFAATVSKFDLRFVVLLVLVALTSMLGVFFNQWAISIKQTSLVYAMEGFQVLFVFIIVSLFTTFFPKILSEKFDKRNLLLKVFATICMVIGIVILYLN